MDIASSPLVGDSNKRRKEAPVMRSETLIAIPDTHLPAEPMKLKIFLKS